MFSLSRAASSLLLLNASALLRSTRSLVHYSPLHPVSRTVFLGQAAAALFASSSFSQPQKSSCANMEEPKRLLQQVYGPVDGPDFPRPMPADEAGLCADGKQRRYLWTDAFGVLAFVSIADLHEKEGNADEANKYRQAADTLIRTVHQCLGSPRSDKPVDAMTASEDSPTGYVGLRIGKTSSRKVTDYGMQYDGQYWHYVDKWLLALARAGHVADGIRIAKSCFPAFFDTGYDGTGWNGGIRWKLSVDASAPPSLEKAAASDDTLVALIVFSILEAHRTSDDMPSLRDEIGQLRVALKGYRPRVTDDPLGWGLEAMYDQWLEGHPRQRALAKLQSSALHPSHLSLPFRLYGAMIGARVAGERVAPPGGVDRLVELSLQHEARAAARGHEEHSTINRVMLAMCLLCPGALGRRPGDPTVTIDKL